MFTSWYSLFGAQKNLLLGSMLILLSILFAATAQTASVPIWPIAASSKPPAGDPFTNTLQSATPGITNDGWSGDNVARDIVGDTTALVEHWNSFLLGFASTSNALYTLWAVDVKNTNTTLPLRTIQG